MMELAGALANGKLVARAKWERHIDSLRKECDKLGFYEDRTTAQKDIHAAIVAAVKERAGKAKKFGVLLSGGVDSSFIALLLKKTGCKFTCFSVGVEGSRDLAAAKLAAKKLKLRLATKEYSVAAAEKEIKEAVRILKSDNPVMAGIAATEVAALKLAKSKGVSTVFSGLGSEEIFAGYQRHAEAEDAHEECWRGLKAMWQRDFLRDYAVAKAIKATALTPLLDQRVIVAAMRARPEWKINGGEKKLILREIAAAAGLPKEIAFRPKMAAQYGSGFDKAMEKLARQRGFRLRREYLAELVGQKTKR